MKLGDVWFVHVDNEFPESEFWFPERPEWPPTQRVTISAVGEDWAEERVHFPRFTKDERPDLPLEILDAFDDYDVIMTTPYGEGWVFECETFVRTGDGRGDSYVRRRKWVWA